MNTTIQFKTATESCIALVKARVRMRVLAGIIAVLPVANVAVPAVKADPTSYLAVDLVSDQPGIAPVLDPTLVNAWGIAFGPSSPFWVSSEEEGISALYAGDVTTPLTKVPL